MLSISDFIQLAERLGARPTLLAGHAGQGRRASRVLVADPQHVAAAGDPGTIILTTDLPPDRAGGHVGELAARGVAALAVQMDGDWDPPQAVVDECNRHDLPLIALRGQVSAEAVTLSAELLVVQAESELARQTIAAHRRFTELSKQDASTQQIVEAISSLARHPAVFESSAQHVVAYATPDAAPGDPPELWRVRGGPLYGDAAGQADGAETDIEVRNERWGRLLLLTGDAPTPTQEMILDVGAAALTLKLLLEDRQEAVMSEADRSAFRDLLHGRIADRGEFHARTARLGHPTSERFLLPVVLRPRHRYLIWSVRRALGDVDADAIVGDVDEDTLGMVLLTSDRDVEPLLESFALRLAELEATRDRPPTVAAGRLVDDVVDVSTALTTLRSFASAVRTSAERPYWTLSDMKLKGLLDSLGDDPRVDAFVGTTLGPLLDREAADDQNLLETVTAYLAQSGNKTVAARRLGVSRQTLYQRLGRIERILDVDLEDGGTRATLSAALMAINRWN